MIIFDLDMTLANCEHRRHFIRPTCKECKCELTKEIEFDIGWHCPYPCDNVTYKTDWKPDRKAFYEACDKDTPIKASMEILHILFACEKDIHIWSGRCETVWDKTEEWLLDYLEMKYCVKFNPSKNLKMRPIGDTTPDDELKERWLDEYLNSMWPKLDKDAPDGTVYKRKDPIQFVFDSDPESIKMWKRRGIFVYNCNQNDEEF